MRDGVKLLEVVRMRDEVGRGGGTKLKYQKGRGLWLEGGYPLTNLSYREYHNLKAGREVGLEGRMRVMRDGREHGNDKVWLVIIYYHHILDISSI